MIDLHVITTASDERSTPALSLEQSRAGGIHTLSVADHDTVAAVAEGASHAADAGWLVPDIEVTSVRRDKDVPVSALLRSLLVGSPVGSAGELRAAAEMRA